MNWYKRFGWQHHYNVNIHDYIKIVYLIYWFILMVNAQYGIRSWEGSNWKESESIDSLLNFILFTTN